MIQEDYCSEELTRLLLKKGCPLEKIIIQDGRPVYFTLPTDHPNWADCDAYYIPTHAQVMKWLRKKGIFIEITAISLETITFEFEIKVIDEEHGFAFYPESGCNEKPTYEEAVEAALKYSFENLI